MITFPGESPEGGKYNSEKHSDRGRHTGGQGSTILRAGGMKYVKNW